MKAVYTLLFTVFLLLPGIGRSQSADLNLNATVLKSIDGLKPAEKISIIDLYKMTPPGSDTKSEKNKRYYARYKSDQKEGLIPVKDLSKYISFSDSASAQMWDIITINNNLSHIDKYGYQTEERKELNESSKKFCDLVSESNETFGDVALQNYVSSILYSVAPSRLLDNRKTNISITIVRDLVPSAFVLPNGSAVITTGLLSELKSEDELASVLAHEMAHYVLDHSLKNYTAQIVREKRAQIWCTVLASSVMIAETAIEVKRDFHNHYYCCPFDPFYYEFGSLADATYGLATILSQSILDHLYIKYNKKQEMEADMIAKNIVSSLGYNANAMSSALLNLKRYCIENDDRSDLMSSYTHPSIDERIKQAGEPISVRDKKYEQLTASATTDCAKLSYSKKSFRKAMELADINIYNGNGSVDDYIIKGASILKIEHTPAKIEHSLLLFDNALQMDPGNLSALKYKVIAYMALNNQEKAKDALNNYRTLLQNSINALENTAQTPNRMNRLDKLSEEVEWIKTVESSCKTEASA